MLIAAALVATVGLFVGSLLLGSTASPRLRLAVSVILALPQLYVGALGSRSISLATSWAIISAPGALRGVGRWVSRPILQLLLLLLALRVGALTWSPDRKLGAASIVELACFIVILLSALQVESVRHGESVRLLRYLWPFAIGEAVLVMVFRVQPHIEYRFLKSPFAGLLAGPNTVQSLLTDLPNNVLDPAKSGGVFVNANVAAMFLGVASFAAITAWFLQHDRLAFVASSVCGTAIFFTGSKSATLLVFLLPLVLTPLAWSMRTKLGRFMLPSLTFVALAVTGLSLRLVSARWTLFGDSDNALHTRTLIWRFAEESFLRSPLQGLGYGGWQSAFPSFADAHGLSARFPPHNFLIYAWAQTGLAGALITVAVIVVALRLLVRSVTVATSANDAIAAVCALGAVLWVFLQGLGENTSLYGEAHTAPILAVLLGYFTHLSSRQREGGDGRDGLDLATPTLYAV